MSSTTDDDALAAVAAASQRAAGMMITADGTRDLQAAQLGATAAVPDPGDG